MNAAERETTVNASDGDDKVRIWTAQRRFITKLRRHPKVTEIRSGESDGSAWAEFELPASEWNPVSGIKRVSNLTPEQRAASAERLAAARALRGGSE